MWWTSTNMFGPRDTGTRLRIAAQGSIGGFLLLCVFEAIARLPIGDYTAISFSSPAFTMVLSTFLLKDRCGMYRSLIGILLVAGVVIISRPPALFPDETDADIHISNMTTSATTILATKTSFDILGISFALAVAVLASLITIITRLVQVHTFHVLIHHPFLSDKPAMSTSQFLCSGLRLAGRLFL